MTDSAQSATTLPFAGHTAWTRNLEAPARP